MRVSLCAVFARHTIKTIASIYRANTSKSVPAPANYLIVKAYKSDAIAEATPTGPTAANNEWRPIYRLPLVRWASAFNALKIYQGIITAMGTPLVYGLEQASQVGPNTCAIFAAVGVSGLLTLALSSFAVQNLVGFIYINQSENKLKLAYVDYWGKRRDAFIDIEDLLPEWKQLRPTRFDFYQPIRLRSNEKRKYKLLQRYGVVLEPYTFATLFGD